jgi:cytochrome c oxidase cbb3-type subunit III
MSDFTSTFWSQYVAIVTVVSVLACLVVALRRVPKRADNTTGHVWDEDLKEMNNPMPMWWMGLFVLTILFGLGYFYLYPGLGSHEGSLSWSSSEQYAQQAAQHKQMTAKAYAEFDNLSVAQLAGNPRGMAMAQGLFLNNCAQCHGSDARGFKGYPNLTDTDWLHGGTPEAIEQSIRKGRVGMMPPQAAAVGSFDDVKNLANYVMSLSGSPHDSVRAQIGKSKFAVCSACHGVGGKGNTALGAPNLSDDTWLHGWGVDNVLRIINEGITNTMPAQENRLDTAQIKLLTAYVWGFSNKETDRANSSASGQTSGAAQKR